MFLASGGSTRVSVNMLSSGGSTRLVPKSGRKSYFAPNIFFELVDGGARPPHLRIYGPHEGSVKPEARPPKGFFPILLGAIFCSQQLF